MRTRFIWLRRDQRGIAPALAEVMMAVTTVAMAASLYIAFGAFNDNPNSIPPAFSFRSFGNVPSQIPTYCCLNDTTVDIIATIGNPQIWGPSMEYTITSGSDGSILMTGYLEEEPTNLTQIYLGIYWGAKEEASIINIWYSDIDRNGIVSIADHLSLRGMSDQFHGAVLRLVANERTVGTQVLP